MSEARAAETAPAEARPTAGGSDAEKRERRSPEKCRRDKRHKHKSSRDRGRRQRRRQNGRRRSRNQRHRRHKSKKDNERRSHGRSKSKHRRRHRSHSDCSSSSSSSWSCSSSSSSLSSSSGSSCYSSSSSSSRPRGRRSRESAHSRPSSPRASPKAGVKSLLAVRDVNYFATKIQSHVRGFLANQRNLSADDLQRVYREIVDELVDDYLSGEFIPDLLIDVLTNANSEYDPVSEEERTAYLLLEDTMNSVVSREIESVVRKVVREFMDDFLHFQTRRDSDPVAANVQRIVEDCTARMTDEVVREALQDMVDAYLFQQQFDVLLDKYLAPIIESTVVEASTEVEVETTSMSLLDATVSAMTEEVVKESLHEAEATIQRQRRRADFALVATTMDRILERTLAKHLLQTIASSGENVVFREQMQLYMNQKVCEALLQRVISYAEVEERLRQSRATRGAMEMVVSRALRTKVRSLFVMSLDDYEAEIDRREGAEASTGAANEAVPASLKGSGT